MNLTTILRSLVAACVAVVALHASSAAAYDTEFSEMLAVFLKGGGWALTTGEPFHITAIFRNEYPTAPPYTATFEPTPEPSAVVDPMPLPPTPEPTPAIEPMVGGQRLRGLLRAQQVEGDGNGEGYGDAWSGGSEPPAQAYCYEANGDGGAVHLAPCGTDKPDQQFVYSASTYMIHSVGNPGMCFENGPYGLHLGTCDASSADQKFMFSFFTFQWLQAQLGAETPSMDQLCFDDGGDVLGQQGDVGLRPCGEFGSPSQTVMLVPTENAQLPPMPTDGTPKLFTVEFPVRLRLFDSFLCVSDSGDAGTPLGASPCSFSPVVSQTYIYDNASKHIRSAASSWLCIADGTTPGGAIDGSALQMVNCQNGDSSQEWHFDEVNGVFTNPHKPGYCVDTGGVDYPNESPLTMRPCHENNWNQVFTVEAVSPMPPPQLPPSTDVGART